MVQDFNFPEWTFGFMGRFSQEISFAINRDEICDLETYSYTQLSI